MGRVCPQRSDFSGEHKDRGGSAILPKELVTCVFHWYSLTTCNFVRLAGWLAQVRDGHPAVAVEFRPDIARVYPVLAVGGSQLAPVTFGEETQGNIVFCCIQREATWQLSVSATIGLSLLNKVSSSKLMQSDNSSLAQSVE